MITTLERDEFIRMIRKWKRLNLEDQEELVSRTLERYVTRVRTTVIEKPVRWLLSAAKLIRHEINRDRRNREGLIAHLNERNSVDRRWNGSPLIAPGCFSQDDTEAIALTGREYACIQVLATLCPFDRQVAELCGIQGFKPAEAARLLSSSRSTVKSRWERLRNKLQLNQTLLQVVSNERRVAG